MKNKTPTIADVAAHAGVSPMTVSRVINGETNVKPATRKTVLTSIKALNYVPNVSARALAGNKSYKVALLYANPSAFYLSELLVGALEAISQHGHQLLVHKVPDSESIQAVAKGLSSLLGKYDGVVVPPPMSDYDNVREFLIKEDLPAVLLSGVEGRGRSRKVCIDDYAAAKEITRHLLKLGHRNIALIKGNPNQFSSGERLRGFEDAMNEAGIDVPPSNIAQGFFTYDSGMEAGRKLLGQRKRPSAIFASNDDMAAAVLAIAASEGISVPDQLSVAGFDDSPLASSVFPRLTTVKQPLIEMAAASIDALIDLLSGKKTPDDDEAHLTVMQYKLVIGASTGQAPSAAH